MHRAHEKGKTINISGQQNMTTFKVYSWLLELIATRNLSLNQEYENDKNLLNFSFSMNFINSDGVDPIAIFIQHFN